MGFYGDRLQTGGAGMIFAPDTDMERQRLLVWAKDRLPQIDDFGPPEMTIPIGIVRSGELLAVAVWHNFRGTNIEVSFAADSPRWATKQSVRFVIGFPFWYIPGVRRVSAICEQRNKRVRKLLRGIGFREEGVLQDLFLRDNGVLYAMTKRWFMRSKWSLSDAESRGVAAREDRSTKGAEAPAGRKAA